MQRTLSAVARLVLVPMLVLGAGLMASPAQAKCGRDCKRALKAEFKACKTTCAKGKAGKACRTACVQAKRAAKARCKLASNPTPPDCGAATTTTTTPGANTTTTTVGCSTPTGTKVKGSLTATPGRFNYNLMLGLPGANAACNTSFPGSHACSVQELQGAPASDRACLKDTANMIVTSFWAIDSSQPPLQQCKDDAVGGSGLNWEYGTAHTPSRGQRVSLDNATGTLGPLQSSVQCNISGTSWVGCCQ